MKVSLTHFIIQKIGEAGNVTLDSFFPKKYSRTHISRRILGLDSYPKIAPRTVSALLSRLKRQGLVERRGKTGASSWRITDKGEQWLKENTKKSVSQVPAVDGVTRLVIFDIPERERRKRDIIRAELVGYCFQQLQRSVWVGFNPLPEDFVGLVDTLHLKNNVHIFSVKEHGTLEK